MTYKDIWEWIYNSFDVNNYFSPEDLLYDVKNEFNRTGSAFPVQAEDIVRERFQYRREYQEMQERSQEAQQVADLVGSGVVQESISDQIIQDLNNPNAEILGINMEEYATTKESVVPPEIEKFSRTERFRGTITSSIKGFFRKLFRR